ncbi:MAG: STAS domain-containing protein [Rhizobiaceae bacterium]|nr:MAG: STAS domain-containing protein [Rhizobiaceae bacterium]
MPSQDLRLGFDNDLTIRHAAPIKQAIGDALRAQPVLQLSLNPDAAVDLSFLQLVAAARAQAKMAGGELSFAEAAGPKLRDVLGRAGFIEGAPAEDLKFWLHSETA